MLVWLNTNGFYAWKNRTQAPTDASGEIYITPSIFEIPGVADIICVQDGVTIFIEAKRPRGGVQSKEQKAFEAQMIRNNIIYILANTCEVMQEKLKQSLEKYHSYIRVKYLQKEEI